MSKDELIRQIEKDPSIDEKKPIGVAEWWKQLERDMAALEQKYPQFAAIKGGQYENIMLAIGQGVLMAGNAGDLARGNAIEEHLAKLNAGLPSYDANYDGASKELMAIYLKHLKRYHFNVEPNFNGWQRVAAKAVGKDLKLVYLDVLGKIVQLQGAVTRSMQVQSAASVGGEAKQEVKQQVSRATTAVSPSARAPLPQPPELVEVLYHAKALRAEMNLRIGLRSDLVAEKQHLDSQLNQARGRGVMRKIFDSMRGVTNPEKDLSKALSQVSVQISGLELQIEQDKEKISRCETEDLQARLAILIADKVFVQGGLSDPRQQYKLITRIKLVLEDLKLGRKLKDHCSQIMTSLSKDKNLLSNLDTDFQNREIIGELVRATRRVLEAANHPTDHSTLVEEIISKADSGLSTKFSAAEKGEMKIYLVSYLANSVARLTAGEYHEVFNQGVAQILKLVRSARALNQVIQRVSNWDKLSPVSKEELTMWIKDALSKTDLNSDASVDRVVSALAEQVCGALYTKGAGIYKVGSSEGTGAAAVYGYVAGFAAGLFGYKKPCIVSQAALAATAAAAAAAPSVSVH